jgi:hypothetical protein
MEEKRSKYDGHEERSRWSKNGRRTKEIDEIIGKREYVQRMNIANRERKRR